MRKCGRTVVVLLLALSLIAAYAPPAAAATSAAAASRYYAQTGFTIRNAAFLDFFDHRGGVRTFGYPISREFTMYGSRVQFFQRGVMQLRPNGSVTTMNILDDGLMPYTQINQSTFPSFDQTLAAKAPTPGSKDYLPAVIAYIMAQAPNTWDKLPVNFYRTFQNTVTAADAYANGKGNAGLLPGFDLELWGIPTSAPTYDPNNHNFVYQRFQRGIMHYDRTTGTTQGLLLGDYLKSIMTGLGLPPDLEAQAWKSPLFRQYDPLAVHWTARPKDLPGSDLSLAFEPEPIIAIDPGHGGTETGSVFTFSDSTILREKDITLKVATRVTALLRGAGIQVLQLRTTDSEVNKPPKDLTGDKKTTLEDELQARLDAANAAHATLLLSIHFNGYPDAAARGTEVYYCRTRAFAKQSRRFADLVQAKTVAELRAVGYSTIDRGTRTDEQSVGTGNHLYVLGPDAERPSEMPGALIEGLFLTNPADAAKLRDPKVQEALAQAYAKAIIAYYQP